MTERIFSVGDVVYLSDSIEGGITDTQPTIVTKLGRVKTVSSSGSMCR